MSNCLCFRCKRFIDLDEKGKEIEDFNNYGYSIFNDSVEVLESGINKEGITPLLNPDTSVIVGLINNVSDDCARESLLYSLRSGGGLFINGSWHEWTSGASVTPQSYHNQSTRSTEL